jgi:hypothetical protein
VQPFDERAAALLTTFAAQAAIAITHVELTGLRPSPTRDKVLTFGLLGAPVGWDLDPGRFPGRGV